MIRLLLVLATVLVLLLVLALMRRGWQQRGRRQAPLLGGVDTTPPAELGAVLVPAATGLYVGTTAAGSWQDRVVAGGLGRRAAATATLHATGAVFDRQGDDPVFLPTAALTDARVEPALAGKVLGRGGLLVLRWHAGGQEFDSGFKADDRAVYVDWVSALGAPATPDQEISQ